MFVEIDAIHCHICNSTALAKDFNYQGYIVTRCNDCKHVFLNPQPSDEVLMEVYSADYFLHDNTAEGERLVSEMKMKTASNYLDDLIEYFSTSKGRLLEIGCGNGWFLSEAQKRGFDVSGIEISEHAVKKANELLGEEKVICGTLENVELQKNHYDICVMFDLIEHVRNPSWLLNEVRNILKPEGVIFIVTPSLDSWSAKLLKNNWMEYKIEHLHYFHTQSIQNVLNKNGFNQIYVSSNSKCLSFEYINNHFQKYKVPFISPMMKAINAVAPKPLSRHQFNIVASGMSVLARVNQTFDEKTLSVVIPLYNEKSTAEELLTRVAEKEIPGIKKEIIVVESNSTDGTREIAERLAKKYQLKLIFEEKARGKGHAVRIGLEYATGEFVLIQDGDLEYDINDYDQLLEPLLNYQEAFVLGSRHTVGDWKMRKFEDQPLTASIMNFGQLFFTGLLNLACGSKMKDPFTMYKVFRRDCLFGLKFESNRFDFDWEIVIKFLRKGYIPREIPVNYTSRSFSEGKKVSMIKDPILWIKALIKFRFFVKLYDWERISSTPLINSKQVISSLEKPQNT